MGSLSDPTNLEHDSKFQHLDSSTPCGHAARERSFKVGTKIEVKICPNPTSYGDFFVYPFSERHNIVNMDNMLLRMSSLGLCRQSFVNFKRGGGDKLCCVDHPISKKRMRARVQASHPDETVDVYFLDTGETGVYPIWEVKELPSPAKDYPPLAFKCSLPIVHQSDDGQGQDMAEVMERFQSLNQKTLVVNVFGISGGSHMVDLIIAAERVTFCEALLRVKDADFISDIPSKLRREILHGFMEREGPAIPSVDKDAWEPISFTARLKRHGFVPEQVPSAVWMSNDEQNEILESVVAEKLFEHSLDHLVKLPPIEELQDKCCTFKRYIGMNTLLLTEAKTGRRYWRKIAETIDNCVQQSVKFSAEEIPNKNQVVLVPFGEEGKYRRGTVLSVTLSAKGKKLVVRVRFLEYGTEHVVRLDHLIKPNQEVMNIPLFVHFVKLSGINDDIPILVEQFGKFRSQTQGQGTVTKVINDPTAKSLLPKVVMVDSKTGKSFAARLNRMAVWKWRQLFRAMYTNVVDIIAAEWKLAQTRPFPSMYEYFENRRITATMKRSDVDVRIQYSCLSNCGSYIVLFCVPNDPIINYQHRTLQSQMQLFFRRVKAPLMSEQQVKSCPHILSVRLAQNSEKKTLFNHYAKFCAWHRVFYSSLRTNTPLNCIDCLWRSRDFKELEITPLPLDFYQASPLGLVVEIDLSGTSKRMKPRHFVPGATKKIKILLESPRIENDFPVYQAIVLEDSSSSVKHSNYQPLM